MNHKKLKVGYIDNVFDTKNIAIEKVNTFINKAENKPKYTEGETLRLKYKGEDGETYSSLFTIEKDAEDAFYISSLVADSDTIKIVEKSTEPDKKSLWLSDTIGNNDEVSDTHQKISSLENSVSKLLELVNRHEYALTHTIAGGDIVANSLKYEMENSDEHETPYGFTTNRSYDSTNTTPTSIKVCIGDSPLDTYNSLFKGQWYYLSIRYYNSEGKEVLEPSNAQITVTLVGNNLKFDSDKNTLIFNIDDSNIQSLYTDTTETITFKSTIGTKELTQQYTMSFFYSESPEYDTYKIPNVKHLITKTVDRRQVLIDNLSYLCLNEFVWCKEDERIYFKGEKLENGTRKTKLYYIQALT